MDPVRLAVVLLVDRRGWVLLQERDEGAPRAADQWGMVGGHVEDGEDFEPAAHRELAEETGLATDLTFWRTFRVHDEQDDMAVYVGPTTVTDADVVCGEGRQIVFVDPATVLDLPLAEAPRIVVPQFLDSPEYASLVP